VVALSPAGPTKWNGRSELHPGAADCERGQALAEVRRPARVAGRRGESGRGGGAVASWRASWIWADVEHSHRARDADRRWQKSSGVDPSCYRCYSLLPPFVALVGGSAPQVTLSSCAESGDWQCGGSFKSFPRCQEIAGGTARRSAKSFKHGMSVRLARTWLR
jgi:hypothetical protein